MEANYFNAENTNEYDGKKYGNSCIYLLLHSKQTNVFFIHQTNANKTNRK